MNAPEFPSLRSRAHEAPPVLRAPAVRLLPIVIFAAVCMLGFRVEVVVSALTHGRHAILQMTPAAALAQSDKSADGGDKPAEGDKDDKGAMATGDKPDAGMSADNQVADANAAGAQPAQPAFNPSTLTKSEIETLQRLAERRDIIEKRERDLDARDGLMKAGESRIDGKIAELHDLQKTIESLLQKYDKQKQDEIDSLVKIYGAMKPKDAAGIFDTLDMPILVSVVQNMKEAKVAPIMALMSREKARALTEELSQRKQLTTTPG